MCRATPVRRCSSTACCSRALRFSRSPSPRTRWRTRRARCSITPSRRSMTTTAARLSKSRFVTGCQCHKLLWWTVHEPDAVELQPDKGLQDLFDQGRQVGEAARARYAVRVRIDLQNLVGLELHSVRLVGSEEHTAELQSRGQLVCRLL